MEATERESLIEAVKDKYGERIMKLLQGISEVVTDAGMVSDDAGEMHDDTYRWVLTVWRTEADREPYSTVGANNSGVDPDKKLPNYDKSVDLTFEIAEASTYGDDPEDGINFSLDIVENGGRIIGGMTPFNYTDQCWVPASDSDAVEERFLLMEKADASDIPYLIGD